MGYMTYELKMRDAEKRGEKRAEKRGEDRLSKLINIFINKQEYDNVKIATSDEKAREKFYKQYGLI